MLAALASLAVVALAAADPGPWNSLHPGGGGQIQDLIPDPLVQGRFYEVSDMEGINEGRDYGKSWTFVRGHLTGEMFSAAFSPVGTPGGTRTVLAVGIYAAQVSHDDGASWSTVEGTANDTVGVAEFSADGSSALVAPGWKIKNGGYVTDKEAPVRLRFNGTRGVWLSPDGGKTFSWTQYEPVGGYRQVYTANAVGTASPGDAGAGSQAWLLGAHSGAYIGGAGGWTRLPLPPGALDGTPDQAGRVGGCRGAAVTPDGQWVYAAWATAAAAEAVTPGGKPPKCNATIISTVFAARLPDGLAAAARDGRTADASTLAAGVTWTDVGSPSLSAMDQCVTWGFPRADPTAPASQHRVLLGWGATGTGRDGLMLGSFQPPAAAEASAAPLGAFRRIGGAFSTGFNSSEGWEYRTWRPFTYAWKPKAWTKPDPRASSASHVWPEVYASGDMNLLRTNWSDPGFPQGANAWAWDMYTRLGSGPAADAGTAGSPRPTWPGEFQAWSTAGFQSTYNYDGTIHENYALQGMADHGIVESWDGGLSWSQFTAPEIVVWPAGCSRSTSVLVTPPVRVTARNGSEVTVPVVLAHAGVGYGASGNKGSLLAKPLEDRSPEDKWIPIAAGGTVFDKACKTGKLAGLPNSNLVALAIDPFDPSSLVVGTEMCGLWATRDWPGLLNATLPGGAGARDPTFFPLTPPDDGAAPASRPSDPLDKAYPSDVAFDAVRPGRMFFNNALGHLGSPSAGLWRGEANSPEGRHWTFTRLMNNTFSRSGSLATWAGAPAGASGGQNLSVLLYATSHTAFVSVDGGDEILPTLTLLDAVAMRKGYLPWFKLGRNTAIFSGATGKGDVLVVGASDPNFRKGYGVFRGVLCDAQGRVEWEDWTGRDADSSGFGPDGFYAAPMYAADLGRSQVVGPPGAETVVLASHLTGMWSRPLNDAGLAALRMRCRA